MGGQKNGWAKKYNLGRLTTGRSSFLGDEFQVVFEMPDVLIEHLARCGFRSVAKLALASI